MFPAGTYRLSAPINLLSNRAYQGQNNPVLLGVNGSYTFASPWDATSSITITGLTFNGAGLALQGANVPADNVKISNCTFQNISSNSGNWTTQIGIFSASGLQNSSITGNTFYNILTGGQAAAQDTPSSAITGYNLKNVTISGNTFNTVNQGMSLEFDDKDTYSGVVISNNTGTQIHRMGIEMQGTNTSNLQVTGNKFTDFLNPFWSTFGLSIVVDGGTGTMIQDNTVAEQPASNSTPGGIGIEVGGKNTTVMNNNIEGMWVVGLALGSAPNAMVTGNYLCGPSSTTQISFEVGTEAAPGATVQGNTFAAVCAATANPPSVDLTQPNPNSILSGMVQLSATASAAAGVASVKFLLDGNQVLGQTSSSPYGASFNTVGAANGSHALTAVAIDTGGLQATSAPVAVSIQNNSTTPLPAGMALWLDAGLNVVAKKGQVSAWTDHSGNHIVATQISAASRPSLATVNGHSVIRFNGSSTWLSLPLSIAGKTGITIFLVSSNAVDSSSGNYGFNAAILWNETAYWGCTYLGPFQTSVAYRFGTTQVNNGPVYVRPASIASTYSLTEAEHNGATDSLYVNGGLVYSEGGKLPTIQGSGSIVTLGQGLNNTYFAGAISEIIIYTRALSDAERNQVETYLMSKYSLP